MSTMGWLLVFLICLVVEMTTPGFFFFACVAIAALAAGILSLLGASPGWCWGAWLGGSTALILTAAPLARRCLHRVPNRPVGFDALVGQQGRVLEDLDGPGQPGRVQLAMGDPWLAVASTRIPAGSLVEVQAITGTRLQVQAVAIPTPRTGALS